MPKCRQVPRLVLRESFCGSEKQCMVAEQPRCIHHTRHSGTMCGPDLKTVMISEEHPLGGTLGNKILRMNQSVCLLRMKQANPPQAAVFPPQKLAAEDTLGCRISFQPQHTPVLIGTCEDFTGKGCSFGIVDLKVI